MNRAMVTAGGIGAAVAVLIGGAALAGEPEPSGDGTAEVAQQPVLRSASVCSNVGGEPDATSRIGLFAIPDVPEPAGDADSGPVSVTPLAGPDAEEPEEPFATLDRRGAVALADASSTDAASYAVRAEGRLAPAVVAEQWTYATGTDLRGLATGACGAPGREFWFVGASADPQRRARLVLTNPTATLAEVSLELFNESGPVDVAGTDDLTVPANGEEVLLLEAIAPDSEHLAVAVRATTGRVVAAIDDRERADEESAGISMIPAAATPAETVVIPGVPGRGSRSLRVVAPGDTDAIVEVQVMDSEGAYRPVGLDVLTVPAGSVLEVPLDEAVGSEAASIRLVADEPVTAGIRVADTMEDGRPDIAFTAAAAPLPAGPLAVVFGPDIGDDDADDEGEEDGEGEEDTEGEEGEEDAEGGLSSVLVLSGVGEAGGRVVVRSLGGDGGNAGETELEIPAGATRTVAIEGTGGTTVVEVAAGGTVAGARVITGTDENGRLIDIMPLRAPSTTVPVPEITAELTP